MSQYDAQIQQFETLVRKRFAFLETEHGFTRRKPRVSDLDEPRDACVSIRYVAKAVSVGIGLGLGTQEVGVVLYNEEYPDPSAPRIRAVYLESVVHHATEAQGRPRSWTIGPFDKDPEGVIQESAHRLRTYAPEILAGDVSSFAEISEHQP